MPDPLLRAIAVLTCSLFWALPCASQFTFLPEGSHFAPLRANIQEARIGVFKFAGVGEMKVDIGNSIDLFGYGPADSSLRITAGIDFMAYAFTTGAQGLRLQIDAIDGFFGGNLTASLGAETDRVTARLRLLHQSAHLVDGHYSLALGAWLDARQPIAYTRDFGELVLAREAESGLIRSRYYAGLSYATLVRPTVVARVAYLAGVELSSSGLLGPLWSQSVNLFTAYQITVNGVPALAATHQVQAGAKFGRWYGKGPAIYIAYYTGRHMFAEYFDERLSTVGVGFTVDFF